MRPVEGEPPASASTSLTTSSAGPPSASNSFVRKAKAPDMWDLGWSESTPLPYGLGLPAPRQEQYKTLPPVTRALTQGSAAQMPSSSHMRLFTSESSASSTSVFDAHGGQAPGAAAGTKQRERRTKRTSERGSSSGGSTLSRLWWPFGGPSRDPERPAANEATEPKARRMSFTNPSDGDTSGSVVAAHRYSPAVAASRYAPGHPMARRKSRRLSTMTGLDSLLRRKPQDEVDREKRKHRFSQALDAATLANDFARTWHVGDRTSTQQQRLAVSVDSLIGSGGVGGGGFTGALRPEGRRHSPLAVAAQMGRSIRGGDASSRRWAT